MAVTLLEPGNLVEMSLAFGRQVGISKDQAGEAIETPDRLACKVVERLLIAGHRPFDERPLHPASRARPS